MDEPQVRACSGVTAETRASLRHLRDAVEVDAAAIALERTELDTCRSIPRVSISSAEEGCVDARYIGELSQHLICT